MTDNQLRRLIKTHTNAQNKANYIYADIICEFTERGLLNEDGIISCLNNTEPNVWEEIMLKLLEENKNVK